MRKHQALPDQLLLNVWNVDANLDVGFCRRGFSMDGK